MRKASLARSFFRKLNPILSHSRWREFSEYIRFERQLLRIHHKYHPLETIYDIGAFNGDWSRRLSEALPNAEFVLFEPNKRHNANITRSHFKVFNELLWSTETEKPFYSQENTGDSIFFDQSIHSSLDPKLVRTRTLDSLVNLENLSKPDFIKIDAQGAELEILKGSNNALSYAKALYIEAPIYEVNSGAPLAHDIINHLGLCDFKVVSFNEHHYLPGQLAQVDIFFARSSIADSLILDLI